MDRVEFDPAEEPSRLILPSGLRVRLIPLQHSHQAAVLVRIHAGSHDAPAEYPGLAHFLEHILFLGSSAYPAEQSLMPFVQRCGGQVNASTRERHTDYFFQVPAGALEKGLERLLDMLAKPLLDVAAQHRELEVLHAEFLARSQDTETLCDTAIGSALTVAHPFAAFHAGNRDTLPIAEPGFQQALIGHHRRFYHAGQCELLIAGPQTPAQLKALMWRADSVLAVAPRVHCQPPRLQSAEDPWLRLQIVNAKPRLNIAFLLDELPEGSAAAVDLLTTWLASEAAGSLFDELRSRGWCESLKLRVPYWHGNQGIAVVEVLLSQQGMLVRPLIVQALVDWLRFFVNEACWTQCWQDYGRIKQRGLLGMDPLARLRYWVEAQAWSSSSDERTIHTALRALLGKMIQAPPIVLTANHRPAEAVETSGFPLRMARETIARAESQQWNWRKPETNPWLCPQEVVCEATLPEPALRWMGSIVGHGQGALFLRWQLAKQPVRGLGQVLSVALQSHLWAARQAGVDMRFEAFGRCWYLKLFGFDEVLSVILRDLAALLAEPPAEAFAQGHKLAGDKTDPAGDEVLIRQLFNHLPRFLDESSDPAGLIGQPNPDGLSQIWQTARWDGLAVGLSEGLIGPVQHALQHLPGLPASLDASVGVAVLETRYHWQQVDSRAADAGLLLFCPLLIRDARIEAAWRLLARLMEGDFFRRLRSELQLGYALFCGFRQVGEHAGIVFAVQSPTVSSAQILAHIEIFLGEFAGRLRSLEPTQLMHEARVLSCQHADLDLRTQAEQSWQACLAGRDLSYPQRMAAAMAQLQPADLLAQLQALRDAAGGWLVIANAPAADSRWQ